MYYVGLNSRVDFGCISRQKAAVEQILLVANKYRSVDFIFVIFAHVDNRNSFSLMLADRMPREGIKWRIRLSYNHKITIAKHV